MNIQENNHIQSRLSAISEYVKTQEAKNFDTSDIFTYLSDKNKTFLAPIAEQFTVYCNCLKSVTRWKNHTYNEVAQSVADNDYDHTLEMLKISRQFKEMGLESIDFDTVEIMVLVHDGGEIITDDISANQRETTLPVLEIKELEPRVFYPLVLRQIKNPQLFGLRKEIGDLYKRYQSRHHNPNDIESHLVKFIDVLQGNRFGMENIYSKEKLFAVYSEDNLPTNPNKIISNMLNQEIDQLKKITDNLPDNQKKTK